MLQNDKKVLDMGAGRRSFKVLLEQINVKCEYKSMDIDRNYFHDFYSIDDIKEKFDYVIMSELLEHLTFDTGLQYLTKAQSALTENGTLFISVLNIWHPNHMWRCDITHITPYPYRDFYAILYFMSFREIEMYRIYHI